ncbi:uncharacterized protein TNCV_3406881 [Trichonephila clavipes]|nr:uncharacterized protein TNCV_3406881 [Trichonephila clavipes]
MTETSAHAPPASKVSKSIRKSDKKPEKGRFRANSSSSDTAKIATRAHERIWNTGGKPCKILLMPSLRDGNAIVTLLMTALITTRYVNHPVPLTTEPSTSLVRVGTDACKSIINSILPYKDYDSHKNAHEDLQKRFIHNPSGHGHSISDRL